MNSSAIKILAGSALGGALLMALLLFAFVGGQGGDATLAEPASSHQGSDATLAEPGSSKQADQYVANDPTWKVIFRSADPSIWNDDVNKGPDHFAMALEVVPDYIRFLRLTDMTSRDFVIIPMTKDRLTKISDDGRYGWDGANRAGWGGHHLGVYFRLWTTIERGEVCVSFGPPNFRGWGFGHPAVTDDIQCFSWAGKRITKTVFEIAVKSEPLTEAESKKWLRAGNPRE